MFGTTFRKLRRIRADELWVRGAQAFAALAERLGWSDLAKVPTDESILALLEAQANGQQFSADGFLEYFRGRAKPIFFAGLADREASIGAFRTRWPYAEAETIRKANHILDGYFDLLGLNRLSFGNPIDWHLEPISGKRTRLTHWSQLDYLNSDLAGDNKIVWELNRQQYFVTLGQAYWLTADERYAQTFVDYLNSWLDDNPPKLGINWASSLELAFRSISWLWAFYFFKDSPSLTPRIFVRALKLLYLHGRHLETYLSTYFSPNTHLTGEALGLFYLGTLLPEFREARRWRVTGRRILLEQLQRHIKPDGVYFEQSSYYHRYTTDFYTHFLILSRLNGQPLPSIVDEKLRLLLEHLMYITRPDGTTPFFGDDDGGRLLMLDARPANDFRAPLSTAAALFGRGDYKFVAREVAEETLWLLGSEGLRKFDLVQAQEPSMQSAAFRDGGYYVMRDGWTTTSNYLLFDCGPHGVENCGHAHADALSIELAAQGKTMLVDPGTCTYTGSKELRDWFRSSFAHNTLTLDGQSSSISDGPFTWKTKATCHLGNWISRTRFDYVSGEHKGYSYLREPAIVTRGILFLKKDYWMVRDRIASKGEHRFDLSFHFPPRAQPVLETSNNGPALKADGGIGIVSFAKSGSWRREDGWVSDCYGKKEPAPLFVFSGEIKETEELVTFLLPRAGSLSSTINVREVEAIGGKAFEVADKNHLDIVMMRHDQRVEMARLASDFEWTWARFSSESDEVPEELVLINGKMLEREGREILKSSRRINYLLASRFGDQFRVETDEGILDLGLPIRDLESAFSRPRNLETRNSKLES